MRSAASARVLFVLLSMLLAPLLAGAEDAEPTLAVGDKLPVIALDDQFGEAQRVDESVRLLAFSRDMDGGGFLREALEGQSAEWLAARGLVSLADIDGMPRLVARMFAIPAMRKRAYPLLLDRDGEASRNLPSEPGRATLIELDALRIVSVRHLDSTDAVSEVFDALPVIDAEAPPGADADGS